MRAMMRTRAFSSSSSDEERDHRGDGPARKAGMRSDDALLAAPDGECAKCASLSQQLETAVSQRKELERSFSFPRVHPAASSSPTCSLYRPQVSASW
jgi:hypothetical protein